MGLSNCTLAPDKPRFTESPDLPSYLQPSFAQYQKETVNWLKENRVYVSDNKAAEIAANSPFELQPKEESKRGVLLVHGLAGSPYYFKDIAKELVKKGFIVRVMLVPGHGSRPADLKRIGLSDWQKSVKHQIKLFKQQVDELWLGGFSTGANLVTSEAISDPDIEGLFLFSPGFKSSRKGLFLAPLASRFIDWVDVDEVTGNYTKYESLTTQAAANYYRSAQEVVNKVKKYQYDKPVLVTISEDDIVIDSKAIYQMFSESMTHPDSRLIWYGTEQGFTDKRVIVREKSLPSERISTFSHMNVLFDEDNPFYGKQGEYRFCNADLIFEEYEKCQLGIETWYAEYGYSDGDRIYARLSWNPYFSFLSESISSLVKAHAP